MFVYFTKLCDMITIGYDFQGWPMKAMNLREILESIGFKKNDAGEYSIKSDDPILDAYPKLLEDDGMAYGVNEQYITEAQDDTYYGNIAGTDVKVFNMFREPVHDLEKDKEQLEKMYNDSIKD